MIEDSWRSSLHWEENQMYGRMKRITPHKLLSQDVSYTWRCCLVLGIYDVLVSCARNSQTAFVSPA